MLSRLQRFVLPLDGFAMRPIQSGDLDALAAIWADPQVTRYLPTLGQPISREQTEVGIAAAIAHWENRGYGLWAIVDQATGQMVGYCGLRYLEQLREVEVLYGLATAYWGRGIITAAVKAAVAYGFEVAKLARIVAMALPINQGSIRVMEKVGLRYEKQLHIFNLEAVYYAICRSEMGED